MKTIGVTGHRGRLGSYLTSQFQQFVPLDCNVTLPERVKECMRSVRPDAVLHLASKSNVDWCEKMENANEVSRTNLRGTFNVCSAADSMDVPVVLMSSDHVFSGKWGRYKETDGLFPVNQYGRSKMSAEALQSAFGNLNVVRTSYFFDRERLKSQESEHYPTFIKRTFIHIHHLSSLLIQYLAFVEEMPKILHLSGSKMASWYDLMKKANKELGWGKKISPRWFDSESPLAPRPRKGGLNTSLSKKLGFPQYSYLDGIELMK